MRLQRIQILKFICCLCAISLLLTGCSIGNTSLFFNLGVGNSAIFSIGGSTCREAEARVYLANYKNLYGSVDGQSLWSEDGNAVLSKAVKEITLENLKKVYVYSAYAKANKIELTEDEKTACANAAQEYMKSLSKADKKYLKTSKKKLTSYYERYLLAKKVYDDKISGLDTDLSEDETRVITANVIYVTDADTAQLIDSAILNKEQKFQLLASTYSEAPSYEVQVVRGMYPENVEETVFALDDGEITRPIEADGGYYFFRCISKYDEDLSETYEKQLLTDRKNEALDAVNTYVEELYKNNLNLEQWEKTEVNYDPEITTNTFFLTLSNNMI